MLWNQKYFILFELGIRSHIQSGNSGPAFYYYLEGKCGKGLQLRTHRHLFGAPWEYGVKGPLLGAIQSLYCRSVSLGRIAGSK